MNVLLFSISTPDSLLLSSIKKLLAINKKLLLLTPHLPFHNEKLFIESQTSGDLFWYTFEDFLSQAEMIRCDELADDTIIAKYGTRDRTIDLYYETIKDLKNQAIINNLLAQFNVEACYLLAHDLGISFKAWAQRGCIDLSPPAQHKPPGIITKFARIFGNKFSRLGKRSISAISVSGTTYLFVGNLNRVSKSFDSKEVLIIDLNPLQYYGLAFVLIVSRSKRLNLFLTLARKVFKYLTSQISSEPSAFLTSVHTYTNHIASSANNLNCNLYCLQDGLVPANYSSRLYKYFSNIQSFFAWDSVSLDFFIQQGIPSLIWEGYSKRLLPVPSEPQLEKSNIVLYLASGAGDWTALKNRSDEDNGFLAFYDLASRHPDLQFVFRPHPVWVHPSHQGHNSIQRLLDFIAQSPLANFCISVPTQNVITNIADTHNVDTSLSLTTLIENSAIVIGDHSDLLITCAQAGKYIASLNVAKRQSFFCGYSNVGLPLFSSSHDLSAFISGICVSKASRESYLVGINKYNSALR